MAERMLGKNSPPSREKILSVLGKESTALLEDLEEFFRSEYGLSGELKFPFGDSYGWGYKFALRSKMLCYAFFETGAFTVTLSLGKAEVPRLTRALPDMLPKTQRLWKDRYSCGEGGWVHYPVQSTEELEDVKRLIRIRQSPKKP